MLIEIGKDISLEESMNVAQKELEESEKKYQIISELEEKLEVERSKQKLKNMNL
jgi:hypothetical protein